MTQLSQAIAEKAKKAIAEKVFPGCVVGCVKRDGEREVMSFGNFTYELGSPAVREDTIYDVASITKSIPTASLALLFIEQAKLNFADKVVKHFPELQNDHGATIEDLLTYRVSGLRLSTLKDNAPDEILRLVFAHGFEGPSGKANYSNVPALLLGIILERVAGDTLDSLAQTYFFTPLGMKNTTFFPDVGSYDLPTSIVPTEIVDGEEIQGIVHDESARVFARARRAVGHAGLFSTAPDLLNFLEVLLHGNDGFTKPVIEGAQKGLGWELQSPFMGQHANPHTFGKTGFTGTSVVCDIERGIAFVILSNRTYPKRPPDANAINAFHADIADILFR